MSCNGALKICLGDYKKNYISIEKKVISQSINLNSSEKFVPIMVVGAKITTKVRGDEALVGFSVDNKYTHTFEILYNAEVDNLEKIFIGYNGKKFEVLEVINIDEENKLLRLNCTIYKKDEA